MDYSSRENYKNLFLLKKEKNILLSTMVKEKKSKGKELLVKIFIQNYLFNFFKEGVRLMIIGN